MTRINLVHPSKLSDKHLIAEYRELPRVFALSRKAQWDGKKRHIPAEYTLGNGHVTFFYDKLLFVKKRQESLIKECLKRGFKIQHTTVDEGLQHESCMNDYTPTDEAIALNIARINKRGGLINV